MRKMVQRKSMLLAIAMFVSVTTMISSTIVHSQMTQTGTSGIFLTCPAALADAEAKALTYLASVGAGPANSQYRVYPCTYHYNYALGGLVYHAAWIVVWFPY